MFYSDILPLNTQTTLNVKLSDFSSGINTKIDTNLLPLNVARNSYNFNFSTGALTTGMGFKTLTLPTAYNDKTFVIPEGVTGIERLWIYKRYDPDAKKYSPLIVIYTSEKEFYWALVETTSNQFFKLSNITFSAAPIGINLRTNGTDKFFFCPTSSSDSLTVWDGVNLPQSYPSAPVLTSVDYHANRLFATIGGDKSQVWFSSDLNPTNWTVSSFDGGFIELTDPRGALNKVVSYNNYLYIIRELGITRVSGYGQQTDFVVRNLSQSNSRIFSNTASLCGDRLMMLCQDGIYQFDGLELRKLTLGFESLFEGVDNSSACGAFLDGKYYVACRMNFNDYVSKNDDGLTNNALIEYDIKTSEYSILRGVDIRGLTVLHHNNIHKLIANFGGDHIAKIGELTHDGKLFDVNTQKVWESPMTDMGYPGKNKIIKSITLLNKFESKIAIFANGESYYFNIPASKNRAVKVPINLRCNTFAVGFYSTESDAYISNPQMEINLE